MLWPYILYLPAGAFGMRRGGEMEVGDESEEEDEVDEGDEDGEGWNIILILILFLLNAFQAISIEVAETDAVVLTNDEPRRECENLEKEEIRRKKSNLLYS